MCKCVSGHHQRMRNRGLIEWLKWNHTLFLFYAISFFLLSFLVLLILKFVSYFLNVLLVCVSNLFVFFVKRESCGNEINLHVVKCDFIALIISDHSCSLLVPC